MRASKRFMVSSQIGAAGRTLDPRANGSTVTPILRGEEGSQLLSWQADQFKGTVYAAKRAKKVLEVVPVWVGLGCLVGCVMLVLVQMLADGAVQPYGGGLDAGDAAERQPLLGQGADGLLPVSSGAAAADGAAQQQPDGRAGGALSSGLVGAGFTAAAGPQGSAAPSAAAAGSD
jgi:hypothetical protein